MTMIYADSGVDAEGRVALAAADTRTAFVARGRLDMRDDQTKLHAVPGGGWLGYSGIDLGEDLHGPLADLDPLDGDALRALVERAIAAVVSRKRTLAETAETLRRRKERQRYEAYTGSRIEGPIAFCFVLAHAGLPEGHVRMLECPGPTRDVQGALTVPPQLEGEAGADLGDYLAEGLRRKGRFDYVRAIGALFAEAARRTIAVGPVVQVGTVERRADGAPRLRSLRAPAAEVAEASDRELERLFMYPGRARARGGLLRLLRR